jgi:hypothetical protein
VTDDAAAAEITIKARSRPVAQAVPGPVARAADCLTGLLRAKGRP